jgi:hypothetical protein
VRLAEQSQSGLFNGLGGRRRIRPFRHSAAAVSRILVVRNLYLVSVFGVGRFSVDSRLFRAVASAVVGQEKASEAEAAPDFCQGRPVEVGGFGKVFDCNVRHGFSPQLIQVLGRSRVIRTHLQGKRHARSRRGSACHGFTCGFLRVGSGTRGTAVRVDRREWWARSNTKEAVVG